MATATEALTISAHADHWARPGRILVATDLNDLQSLTAAALSEARRFGSSILLVHVLPDFASPSMAPSLLVYAQPEHYREYAESRLASVCEAAVRSGARCSWKMVNGDIERGVAKVVEDWAPHQVILGSRGALKFYRHIVGSLSERLFRGLQLPALVVGPHAKSREVDGPMRVLVPVSLRRNSRFLFEAAATLQSFSKDYSVRLLHVMEEKRSSRPGRVEAVKSLLTVCQHRAAGLPSPIPVVVRTGAVTESILEVARDEAVDLVVLGNMSASSFASNPVVNSAYGVLCEAVCPVMILHEGHGMAGRSGLVR